MKLFSFLLSTLLLALAAAQTCTPDVCRSRIGQFATVTGRAFCFTYLTPTPVVIRTTRVTAVSTLVSTSVRTTRTITTTAIGTTTIVRRQILPSSVASAIASACTNNVSRVSSACSCYLAGR